MYKFLLLPIAKAFNLSKSHVDNAIARGFFNGIVRHDESVRVVDYSGAVAVGVYATSLELAIRPASALALAERALGSPGALAIVGGRPLAFKDKATALGALGDLPAVALIDVDAVRTRLAEIGVAP